MVERFIEFLRFLSDELIEKDKEPIKIQRILALFNSLFHQQLKYN